MSAADVQERIRALALSLPQAYEDAPWGHPVFKVADNKLFAMMSADGDTVHLTVKLTAEEREIIDAIVAYRETSDRGVIGLAGPPASIPAVALARAQAPAFSPG